MATVTTKVDFTTKDVVREVRRIAAENPDFVYTPSLNGICSYHATEGNPQGCIIGAALKSLGVDVDVLAGPANTILRHLGLEGVFYIEDVSREAEWVQTVQSCQDCRKPWGEAVSLASERYPEVE
jgi:hypothetical protein